MEDAFPVEAKDTVKGVVSGHLTYQIDDGGTYGNVEHQIGDAFITVCIAEPFEAGTKVFQFQSLLLCAFPILPVLCKKVYNGFVNDCVKKEGKMVLTF